MKIAKFILIFNFIKIILNEYDNCYFYDDQYNCVGGVNENEWDAKCFQTPKKDGTNDPVYLDTYQGMHYIVGYIRQKYSE